MIKCSSGCGTGYSTRNVTCTNGHIENPSECTEPRPIKYKQCENKNHCRWRYGKWKNCTCAGYQKRRITCWDSHKNAAANNCPADDKPTSRQRCSAPPNCKEIICGDEHFPIFLTDRFLQKHSALQANPR